MGRLGTLAALLAFTLACATSTPAPASAPPEAPFELRLMPAFAFAGQGVWITCHVPESFGAGRVRFGLEGVRISESDVTKIQHRLLIERLDCGEWTASCTVASRVVGLRQITKPLQVLGAGCGE